jgi:hypothetical protein
MQWEAGAPAALSAVHLTHDQRRSGEVGEHPRPAPAARFTVARSISVQALIDGEPVGQATAPLIVPSTFLDPAREDGYPWGPNCSWMPAAGGAIGPAGSLVIQSSPWDS